MSTNPILKTALLEALESSKDTQRRLEEQLARLEAEEQQPAPIDPLTLPLDKVAIECENAKQAHMVRGALLVLGYELRMDAGWPENSVYSSDWPIVIYPDKDKELSGWNPNERIENQKPVIPAADWLKAQARKEGSHE